MTAKAGQAAPFGSWVPVTGHRVCVLVQQTGPFPERTWTAVKSLSGFLEKRC